MGTKLCICCGECFDAKGSAKTCSQQCREVRRRETNRQWRKSNPEKYQLNTEMSNTRRRMRRLDEKYPPYMIATALEQVKTWVTGLIEENPEKFGDLAKRVAAI